MRITLSYGNGIHVEGILLATAADRMRVVVPGSGDAVEFSREGGVWRADSGESVEIEAMTAMEGVDIYELLAGFAPRTMGAGQSGF